MGRPIHNQFYPAAPSAFINMPPLPIRESIVPTETQMTSQNMSWDLEDMRFKDRYIKQRDAVIQAGKALRLLNALKPDQMSLRSMGGAASLAANAPIWLSDNADIRAMRAKSAVNGFYYGLGNAVESGLSTRGHFNASEYLPTHAPFDFGAKGYPLRSEYRNAIDAKRIKNALQSALRPRDPFAPDFDPNEDPFK